jgi:TolB-like protein
MIDRTRRKSLVAVAFLGSLAMAFSEVHGQSLGTDAPAIEIRITSAFDTSSSSNAENIRDKYFGNGRALHLARIFGEQLQRALQEKLDDMFIRAIVTADPSGEATGARNSYDLACRLSFDTFAALSVNVSIAHRQSGRTLESFSRAAKKEVLARSEFWQVLEHTPLESEQPDMTVEAILFGMATVMVDKVHDELFRWIASSSLRIRVEVSPFRQLGGSADYGYLAQELRSIVESRLAGAEDILVFASSDDTTREAQEAAESASLDSHANYRIEGTFVEIEGELGIEVRCIKVESQRILVSAEARLEEVSIKALSRSMTDVSYKLKRAMEADFRTRKKTLAVAANPPVRLFNFGEPKAIDVTVTREIVRTLTQKLRLLTMRAPGSDPVLRMHVLEETSLGSSSDGPPATPAEVMADLHVDYLVMLTYEDLGNEFRLSSSLHSYELGHAGIAAPIYVAKANKVRVNDAVDSTACRLLSVLEGFGKTSLVMPGAGSPSHLEDPGVKERLKEVGVSDVRRTKGFGLRIGSGAPHDPDLYLGKKASRYYEIFFSYLVPGLNVLGLDYGLEPSFGVYLGRVHGFFRGTVGATGLLNFKVIYSGQQYANIPLVLSAGLGLGGQGMRHMYNPGDSGYLGERKLDDGVFRFALTVFAEAEFPVTDTWRFHGLLRWISPSKTITSFQNAEVDFDGTPTGRLGGIYFVAGVKYTWR